MKFTRYTALLAFVIVVGTMAAISVQADESTAKEAELLAVLRSDAPDAEKAIA